VIEGIEEQPENVYPPMCVTVSGIMMGHDRLLQFQKASYIFVVPIGIFVLFRFSQKAKAEPRLQLVIEEGRVTETRLVQPEKKSIINRLYSIGNGDRCKAGTFFKGYLLNR
jgi:hypothetical protein